MKKNKFGTKKIKFYVKRIKIDMKKSIWHDKIHMQQQMPSFWDKVYKGPGHGVRGAGQIVHPIHIQILLWELNSRI